MRSVQPIAHGVLLIVGQEHVPDSELGEHAHALDGALQRLGALKMEPDGQPAGRLGRDDLLRGGRHHHPIGMRRHPGLDPGDLAHRRRQGILCDVDGQGDEI